GLGKHLLAIEARQQYARNTEPENPGQPAGTLSLIASRLRDGRDGASISAELGVSASEIHLVEMVLRQTADQAADQVAE
ncbi:MAG: hypothetical protein KJO62_03370, partial [Gammaproteobacteria bacterium]|nr:hypothetical protein [Gammaproteobacteria bacterium]